jgi:carbonic anhydrase
MKMTDMSQNDESDDIQELFDHNREWAAQMERDDPGFFVRLAKQQEPDFLWIGCSDSRVPANQITGLMPGEVFVHRNVANVVMQTDLSRVSNGRQRPDSGRWASTELKGR